jgi:hypothetical protein
MAATIQLIIEVPDTTNVNWSDIHKKITDRIASGADPNVAVAVLPQGATPGVYGGTWTTANVARFKEQVVRAATEYAGGVDFSTAIKNAEIALNAVLDNVNATPLEKVTAYEIYRNALKDADTGQKIFIVGGGLKRGGSKRRGSKRGSKKRRGSKSKRRKH